jgi:hypothetical protein
MGKGSKSRRVKPAGKAPGGTSPVYSPGAQELRALLRRVPDGFQATLHALTSRADPERQRLLEELARGMGKEILPLVRAAALGKDEELAHTALRVLPVFGTRAAGEVLVEAYHVEPGGERARLARQGARALQAQGIQVPIPETEESPSTVQYTLRETSVTAPDGVGSRSTVARLQDQYGVWYAIMVLWNDQAGVKDGFMRPMSRHEWAERQERLAAPEVLYAVCPPDFARWQVANARAVNDRSGLPLGDNLKEWDQHVGPPPPGYTPPDPTAAARAAGVERWHEWRDQSAALFETPAVERWFLEAADCVPWARQWGELQTRLRFRGSDERTERELQAVIRSAAESMLDEAMTSRYRERLLDLARLCEWQEAPASRSAVQRWAAAAVLALDEGAPPAEIPFFVKLVERSLGVTYDLLRRGEDPERSRYQVMKRYQS